MSATAMNPSIGSADFPAVKANPASHGTKVSNTAKDASPMARASDSRSETATDTRNRVRTIGSD
jgi:hypothetical protein